jgi:hypothetical protein
MTQINETYYDEILSRLKGKNLAYFERDQLVVLVSKLFPSYLCKHPEEDETWERDWMNIVNIELPTCKQARWHIHDDEVKYFSHLEYKDIKWDGTTTARKYSKMFNIKPIIN